MSVRAHLLPLTSLRFVAAMLIVLAHSRTHYEFSRTWGDPLDLTKAVNFFFVLSGFVLAYAYPSLDAAGTRRFLVARAARLWPLHIVTFVLFLPVVYLYAPLMPSSTASAAPANLALVHAWVPYPDSYFSFNPVSWTISTEVGLYLLFPLLIHNWRGTWGRKLVLSVVMLGVLEHLARWLALPPFEFGRPGADLAGVVAVNPLANMYPFVLGMAACSVWHYLEPRLRPGVLTASIVEFSALAFAGWSMSSTATLSSALRTAASQPASHAFTWVPGLPPWSIAFPLLVVVMALGRGLVSRLLSLRAMVRLGEVSFALYLVHYGIMLGFAYVRPWAPHVPDPVVYALFWMAVLVASWVLWRWVEWPARGFVRAWWHLHEPRLSRRQWQAVGGGLTVVALLILVFQFATLR